MSKGRFLIAFSAAALLAGCHIHHDGIVTAKNYIPGSSGVGFTSKGHVVYTSTSPQWILELDNGADEVNITHDEYMQVKIGMHVVIDEHMFYDDIRVTP